MNPEQIEIIFVDPEGDRITLLSRPQRNFFIEQVTKSTEEKDTVLIAERTIEKVFAEDELLSF